MSNLAQTFAVFVKHPPHIPQDKIQAVIQACGRLYRWKPTRDPSTGLPKNFGFAEFADMDGIARLMRLLTPLKFQQDGSSLLIRLDKAMQQTYQNYIDSHPPIDPVAEQYAEQAVQQELGEFLGTDKSTEFLSSVLTAGGPKLADGIPESMPPSTKEQTVKVDENKSPPPGFVKANETSAVMEDEEAERRDQEQAMRREAMRKQDAHRSYLTELNKWESRERYRAKLRHENQERDQRWAQQNDPEKLLEFYSRYDDDDKEADSQDDWFHDRDRWIERRKRIREFEERWDENDRRQEERPVNIPAKQQPRNDKTTLNRRPDGMNSQNETPLKASEIMTELQRLVKRDLPFLHPMNRQGSKAMFDYQINWESLSQDTIKNKVLPLIENKVVQFLGEKDPDLVEFILEAVMPGDDGTGKDPMEVLAEITSAFGESAEEKDEANDLVEQIWRCVIWETEKRRLVGNRAIIGLEVSLEDLEIGNVQ